MHERGGIEAVVWRATGTTRRREQPVHVASRLCLRLASRRDAQYFRIRSATAWRCSSVIVRFRLATTLSAFLVLDVGDLATHVSASTASTFARSGGLCQSVRPAGRRTRTPLGREVPTGAQDDRRRPDGAVRRVSLLGNHAPPVHARRRLAAPILRALLGGSNTMRLEFTLAGVSPLITHNGVSMLSRARIEGRARPPRGVNPYIRAPAPTCTYDGRTSRPIPTSPPVSVGTDRGATAPARDSDGRARRTRRPANPCTCRARSMTLILCGGLRKSGQSSTSRS